MRLCAAVAALAVALPATATAASYKVVGQRNEIGISQGQFSSNTNGLAVDPVTGDVFVADTDNHRIQVFTPDLLQVLAEWGGIGSEPGHFNVASDVAIAADGKTLWVSDQQNSRIQQFDPTGKVLDVRTTSSDELPRAIGMDGAGNIYVGVEGSATGGIRKYQALNDPFGAELIAAGIRPGDVEISPDGTFFMSTINVQTAESHVRRYGLDGTFRNEWDLLPSDGQRGLGIDLDCNVWAVHSTGSLIDRFSPTGKLLGQTATSDFGARDIAFSSKGDMYVIEQNHGVVHYVEDTSKPDKAQIPAKLKAKAGVVRIPFKLPGVACPLLMKGTATLKGKGISGSAKVQVAAGKATTIPIRLSAAPLKKAAAKSKATFKIVLGTNGRKTTQVKKVTLRVR